jgi:serine/threonine protein kinase
MCAIYAQPPGRRSPCPRHAPCSASRVRARSQADHLSQAQAPRLQTAPAAPPQVEEADEKTTIDPVGVPADLRATRRVDAAADETAIDPLEPDNEPTTVRPAPPAVAPRKTRFARGSSHGLTPDALGRIGKYELRDKLGRGAFGVVFTARDPSLDREVAIKVLRPTHRANQEIVQRFLQEARATARIAHPGIVTIHDCGQVETNLGATAFIAMELLTGARLTCRLAKSGRLPPAAAIEIARQIASALEMAHRVDVLHRDLKPDNIYLVPDPAMPSGERVKILDFGLAKLGREGHTQLQTVFGTPKYMSPEQCRSATQLDHRSDIYSLGCVLFELVTGRVPFDGDARQQMESHQRVPPPRASSLVPELPPALDNLIAEMLAKDPMRRPQTMGAVQRALHQPSEPFEPLVPLEPRKPSEPPVQAQPGRPHQFDPPERREIPRNAWAQSGVTLVPATPPTSSRRPDRRRRAKLNGFRTAGLVTFALALIALLKAVWAP